MAAEKALWGSARIRCESGEKRKLEAEKNCAMYEFITLVQLSSRLEVAGAGAQLQYSTVPTRLEPGSS